MEKRPPARPREDALLEAERLRHRCIIEVLWEDLLAEAARCGTLLRMLEHLCERCERDLAELQMVRERAALLEGEANRETWRREALERRVEILEEENRNLRRRTH